LSSHGPCATLQEKKKKKKKKKKSQRNQSNTKYQQTIRKLEKNHSYFFFSFQIHDSLLKMMFLAAAVTVLLLVVVFNDSFGLGQPPVIGNTTQQLAYDLFEYSVASANVDFNANKNGVGFGDVWDETSNSDCVAIRIGQYGITAANFTTFVRDEMSVCVGATGADICSIARAYDRPQIRASGVRYFSFLLTTSGALLTNRASGFLISVGERSTGVTLGNDGVFTVNPPTDDLRTIQLLGTAANDLLGVGFRSGNPQTISPLANLRVLSALVVLRLQWSNNRITANARAFDAIRNDAVDDSDIVGSNVSSSFTLDANKLNTIQIALARFYVAQVRVGDTLESVFNAIPVRSQFTVMPPASSSSVTTTMSTTATTTTTTTATTATTPATTTSAATNSTQLQQPCVGAASCSQCLAIASCKWCTAAMTAGRCTQSLDDKCDLLTLSASGCSTLSSETTAIDMIGGAPIAAPDATGPIIIGGALGGVAALIVIVALAVFCFAKRRSRAKPADERTTATADAESSAGGSADAIDLSRQSGAATVGSGESGSSSSALYGDIRLTNAYSVSGLQINENAKGAQSHYTPMAMKQ
jgi:hypothetical protein